MTVTLFRQDGMWIAHVGVRVIPLIPASESLYRLVTAIRNTHPNAIVWLDPGVTDNPFIQDSIRNLHRWGMAPFYQDVQYALDNPQEKDCSLCGGRAFYYPRHRTWVCTKCEAHADGNRFFRLSRKVSYN